MSAKVKPGYRKTEVGVIPNEWQVKSLSEISDKIMVGIASSATHAYRSESVWAFLRILVQEQSRTCRYGRTSTGRNPL